jgi:hypothetical protein
MKHKFFSVVLVCLTNSHNPNRDYIILIMQNSINLTICIKLGLNFYFFQKVILIFLKNLKLFKKGEHPSLGSNTIFKKDDCLVQFQQWF